MAPTANLTANLSDGLVDPIRIIRVGPDGADSARSLQSFEISPRLTSREINLLGKIRGRFISKAKQVLVHLVFAIAALFDFRR